jgi:hypothetical protein
METKNELNQRIDPVWTIWVPLGVTILIVLLVAISYIVLFTQGGEISKWASAFTVLALLTILLTSIVTSLILMFSIGGMKVFSGNFPEWMKKAQIYSTIGNENEKRIMAGLTKPVMVVNQIIAGIGKVFSR